MDRITQGMSSMIRQINFNNYYSYKQITSLYRFQILYMNSQENTILVAKLLENRDFIAKLREQVFRPQEQTLIVTKLVEQIKQIVIDLIHFQLQNELKELIEDNNRILKEIQVSLMKKDSNPNLHEINQQISFTERQRVQQQINDASLDKSISAFVELKVETIQEKVMQMDKRLKGMQDKYQTNLNSIWNVLSITQSAIFDHLKETKQKRCKEKQTSIRLANQNQSQKRSILGFLKFGSK